MYYPYFITYITMGVAISLVVFFWALKTGQFRDQQRARFLPLEKEDSMSPARATRCGRFETYGLFILAVLGIMASGAVLIFALLKG